MYNVYSEEISVMQHDPIRSAIGKNIRHYRRTRQLKQYELAEKAACRPNLLSRIERGLATPSIALLLRIAQALNCAITDLLAEPPSTI